MRGKPFILKLISVPFLFHPADIFFIADMIYFPSILMQLLGEGEAKLHRLQSMIPRLNGSHLETVPLKMYHRVSHFYKFFTPSCKSLFQLPIKI